MRFYDTRDEFLSDFLYEHSEFQSWEPSLLYSSLVRVNPDIQEYILDESKNPEFRTADDVIDSIVAATPELEVVGRAEIASRIVDKFPGLNDAWGFDSYMERPEDRPPEQSAYDNWIGRKPEKPLDQYESGKKILDLERNVPQSKLGAFVDQFVGRGVRDWVPYASEAMDSVELAKIANSYRKFLRDGTDENLSDEELVDLNLYMKRMERESAHGWASQAGAGLRQSLLFAGEFAAYATLQALTMLTPLPGDEVAVGTLGAKSIASKVLRKKAKAELEQQLVQSGAMRGGKIVRRATAGRLFNRSLKDSATEALRDVFGVGAEKGVAASLKRGAARTLATQGVNLANAAVMAAGKEALIGGATYLATGEFDTRRSQQMQLEDMLETGVADDGAYRAASYFDGAIENYSEFVGDELLGAMFGKLGSAALDSKTAKAFGASIREAAEAAEGPAAKATTAKIARALLVANAAYRNGKGIFAVGDRLADIGYNGFLQEFLEERVGDVIRGLTGLEGDEELSALARGWDNAFNKTSDEWYSELLVLAVPLAGAHAVSGGLGKLSEHTAGYAGVRRMVGHLVGYEADLRKMDPNVELRAPATKEEEAAVAAYREAWKGRLRTLVDAGTSVEEATAMLAEVESGKMDGGILDRVRAERATADKTADWVAAPFDESKPVVVLKPVPQEAIPAPTEEDLRRGWAAGTMGTFENDEQVREFVERGLLSGTKQRRGQGFVIDLANRLAEWATMHRFVSAENRTYGDGRGFEPTPELVQARQGAVDIIGFARRTYENSVREKLVEKKLWNVDYAELSQEKKAEYDLALQESARAAANQAMVMVREISHLVQYRANLSDAEYADLAGRAGLEATPENIERLKKANADVERMLAGKLSGGLYRDRATGRIHLKTEARRLFDEDMEMSHAAGSEVPVRVSDAQLRLQALEWRGVDVRRRDLEDEEARLEKAKAAAAAAGVPGVRHLKLYGDLKGAAARLREAADASVDAAQATLLRVAAAELDDLYFRRGFSFSGMQFNSADFEQANKPAEETDTLAVRTLRKLLNPSFDDADFQKLLFDHGYANTEQGVVEFKSFMKRTSDVLRERMDRTSLREGDVVVEATNEKSGDYRVAAANPDGTYRVARFDAKTGEFETEKDSAGNPVLDVEGKPRLRGEILSAGRGRFVRKAVVERVSFMKSHVLVDGTAAQFESAGLQGPSLEDRKAGIGVVKRVYEKDKDGKPTKRLDPEKSTYAIRASGTTSPDGKTVALSFDEATLAEEVVESALKQALGTVPAADGSGLKVSPEFKAAADEVRERLARLGRRASKSQKRLLDALSAPDPDVRARYLFELQGKVQMYGNLGFDQMVDALGHVDSFILRDEAMALIEETNEDGKNPLLETLAKLYRAKLGDAAYSALAYRSDAKPAAESPKVPGAGNPPPKGPAADAVRQAELEHDEAVRKGKTRDIRRSWKKVLAAREAAGMSGTSATRASAYEVQTREQLRLANVALGSAKVAGDPGRAAELRKLRDQLRASLAKAESLRKAGGSLDDSRKAAAKRTGYGTDEYETTRSAFTDLLFPELLRSGALLEADVEALKSRSVGYEAAAAKLAGVLSRPFMHFSIGKMEGEAPDVAAAIVDQVFGPLRYEDGVLPAMPQPLGDRTGMSDEQVAEAERDFDREFSMFELSQQAVNQALDGDAREAEAAGRLSEQISRAVLAERMGPFYAMGMDRMRASANVRGAAAFGMPLSLAGGVKKIAEASKKSDALAATSPIWNEASWAAFQSADVSKWETWEKDFHDVAKRMSYAAAKAMWPAWFGRRFQELLKADIAYATYAIGPDGRLLSTDLRGSVNLVGGASDGQTGTVVSAIQAHVANRVRTADGLKTMVEELGQLFGHKPRRIGIPRLRKQAFAESLRTKSGAESLRSRLPASAWVMQPDQKTPASTPNTLRNGKREVTSMSRSLTYFGWLAKNAYAANGLERFLPWAQASAQEKRNLLSGSASLYDAVERAARGEKLSESEIANAAEEYDRVMRAGEAASFFLKDLYVALDKAAKSAGEGDAYDYESVRSAAYAAISGARVHPTEEARSRGDAYQNNAGIAIKHLGSLAKESSRSTGMGSKPLQMHQRHMAYFDLAEEARRAGILYSGEGTGIAMVDLEADAWTGELRVMRVDGSFDGYGRATPARSDGMPAKRRGFRRGPDDQNPQEQYIAALMAVRFGKRGPGGYYAYPIPMADKKRMYSILLDAGAVEAEAKKVSAEFPDLKNPEGGYGIDVLLTAMDRLMMPIVSRADSFGPEVAKELSTSLKAMVKRLRLLSTSGDMIPITEGGMRSSYRAFVAEEIYLEVGKGEAAERIALPKKADPFDGGAYALRGMLEKLDESRGRKRGTTHSAKLQETGSALYKGNLTSADAVLRTEEILANFGLSQLNPVQAGLSRIAESVGVDMWTTPGAEKAYDKSPGVWPVDERREAIELPDGTKATLVAKGRVLTHWTASTLEVANLVRQAAPSAKDTTVSVPYNVSQATEAQRDAAKLLFDLDLLRAELSGGLYSVEEVLAKAAARAASRDDYVGGMLERGMSIKDPHALADVIPSLLSSSGKGFSSSSPTISAQMVPSGEVLGESGRWFRNPFLAPPGERDGKSTAGLAMVNDVAPGARYLWAVDPKDLADVKDAIVRLARDPKSKEAKAVLREKVRDYFLQEPTGRESVEDLVLDDFSFDEDAVREIGGKTYVLGTGGIGYRIPGGKDGMAAGFFRLTLPATLDTDADGRVVAGRENYAMIAGQSAGQRGEDFDGDMFYFKLAQRGTADIDGLRTRAKAALEARDDEALADLLKETDRAANAAHVRAVRGMTPAQANAVIDKTIADRVVALDGRTVGDHAAKGLRFDAKAPYLKSGRGLAAMAAKDDANLKGVIVSAADSVSMQSLYGLMHKFAYESEPEYRARLEVLQRALTNFVNIALDVVNEPRADALRLSPKTLPLLVAFLLSRQWIDAAAERDPAKTGDPGAKGTVAWAIQRWVEFTGRVEFAAYEAFAETMPEFEMDKALDSDASFGKKVAEVAARMRKVSAELAADGVPVDRSRWNGTPKTARAKRVRRLANEARKYHRRGRIAKAADRGFATTFDVLRLRKDLEAERAESPEFAAAAPFRRAEIAVARALGTLRAAFGDEATEFLLALDPKFRSVFDERLDEILSERAAKAVESAHAAVLAPYAPGTRARVAQAVVEKLIADPRMADSAFANSLSAQAGRDGRPRIKHVAPRTPPMLARKAADEFWTRLSSFGPIEVAVDGSPVSVPADAVPALIALQQIEEHGVGPARFKGGIYHFLPASFQTEVAKQFEGAPELAPAEEPAPPAGTPMGPSYLEFLSRLPESIRDEMRRSVDSMGPDTADLLLSEVLGEARIREELQIARNIANEQDDAAGLNAALDDLETELLGGSGTSATRVVSVDADGTVNLAFTGKVQAKAESNFQKKYWTLEKALQESGFKKPEVDFIKSVSPSPASLAEAVQASETWMRGQMEVVLAPGRSERDEVTEEVLPARPEYERFSVNKGQGEYREYFIRGKFPVPGQHGEFTDPNLLGWFRARAYDGKGVVVAAQTGEDAVVPAFRPGDGVRLLEIQEIQSELFQKNKGGFEKATMELDSYFEGRAYPEEPNPYEADTDDHGEFARGQRDQKAGKVAPVGRASEAAFLNLMLKDQTWVPVFVDAIAKWARTQGYEKVRFPTGETAARVEGHQVLADRLTKLQAELDRARQAEAATIADVPARFDTGHGEEISLSEPAKFGAETIPGSWSLADKVGFGIFPLTPEEALQKYKNSLTERPAQEIQAEIDTLKTQGIEKLAPIEAFYEKRVGKIVRAMGSQPVTDANGNTWNEMSVATSATRRATIDAGNRTLTELYMGLAARKNDAADADRMRKPVAEKLDSDDAAVRAAARAEVLRDLDTLLSRKPGAKYSGVVSRVNDLIGRLAAMDSILADTTTEPPAAPAAPAAPKQAELDFGAAPGEATSATRASTEAIGIAADKLVTDPNEIAGASPDNPLSLSDKVAEDRMLSAQGLPVRELLEDRGTAAAIGAFRGWLDDGKLAPQAAGLAALVAAKEFVRAHEALPKLRLPEELENRVRRALFDAEEHAAWSHRDFADFGFDPVAEPIAGFLDAVGEDAIDFRQIDGGATSTTQTMDWVVRNQLAMLSAYGGAQRVHHLMRDTAYFVNAENKKLGHVLTRERAVFQEDARGTFFRRSVDASEIDSKTGLPKKEYLRGFVNRVTRGDSKVALTEKDRNLLTRVWAAVDALMEGSPVAVYGGERKFTRDEAGKRQFTYSETTKVDENGVPDGDVESVDRILRDFASSELYAKYRANGRTEADLDVRKLAKRLANEYAGFRDRLNAQAGFLVGGRDYLQAVENYVPHQFANPGFDAVSRKDARTTVERAAESRGRRNGERAPLPTEAFDASGKSAKRARLPEQADLTAKLAEELDRLTGNELAAEEIERAKGDDLRAANGRILRLAREVEVEKAERNAASGAAYEMDAATADLIAGLKHAIRNYAVREWSERTEERFYPTYFDAYVGSEGKLARRAVDPFDRLDQYVSEVTSVMQAQLMTQLSMLVPDQNGNLFAIGMPDLDRLAEQAGDRRRLVNESVVKAQVEFISRQNGIKDVPGETSFHRLKWLVDNGYAFGKGGLKSDYVELRSPYASMSKIYVQKGRASALFQKIMNVDPQLLFRLVPGGTQRDLVRILGDFVMLTKHMAVSWSAFFVFAGVEGMIAQGGLRHNALYHPIESVKKLVDMRRKIRRGDAELDQTIYDLHRAGMDLSEHNLTDGATSVVDRWAANLAENFARASGYEGLGKSVKLGFNVLSGRWLSQKIMGDFFPMMKMWGAMEMIENARKHMPGVPIDRIRRALAPSVNDAFGGQMFVDYPALTPKLLKVLNLSMFAPNWCCPLDSQALTKTGWKNYDEIGIGDEILIFDNDTGKTRWGPVRDKFVDEAYEGDMVHVRNYGHDLRMTPEHTCVVTSRGGTERRVRKAKTLSTNDGIPRCAAHSELPTGETVSDRLVVLAGWLVTDGSVKRKKRRNANGTETEYRYGRIAQSKPATVEILKKLGLPFYAGKLKDTNFHANYVPHTFSIPVSEYKELESLGVADGKLSWEFLSRLTERQLRLLADTMMLGDGTGQNRFCGEENEIFWMTLINVLLGKPVTFYEQKQEGQRCWRTRHVSARTISCHRKEIKPYSGGIWCPSVDTGFWVTQQNGVVFITGNTISAWNVAGGQLLTGARFGNFLTMEGERFVFAKNWPAMYLYVLLAIPCALQAGVMLAAKAAGGGDDPDDEWFAWNNERDKGGLFPSIDITPVVRMMPGYEGGRTKKRRQYVQFGKQSYEVIDGWLKDPWKTFLRKTSMPVKLVWEQVFGHSPGSPDFNLAFHRAGLAGVLSSPYEGSGYEKFARSRAGSILQKFIPLSFSKLMTGDMDAWAVMGIAPASKGISQTRAIQGMARILETYADSDSFGRLKTSAAARMNLEKATWEFMVALQKNGDDPYAALKAARGMVMKRHYGDFFKAFERKDDAGMDRAARSLLRLSGTSANLTLSLQAKFKLSLKRKMTPEEKAAAIEAFEGQIPTFYREGED